MHDPRVGRFFTRDPIGGKFPWNSPYAFSENRVIDGIELEGLELYLQKLPRENYDKDGDGFDFGDALQSPSTFGYNMISGAYNNLVSAFNYAGDLTNPENYWDTKYGTKKLKKDAGQIASQIIYKMAYGRDGDLFLIPVMEASTKIETYEGLAGDYILGLGLGRVIRTANGINLKSKTIKTNFAGKDVRDAVIVQHISPDAKIADIIHDALEKTYINDVEHALIKLNNGDIVLVSGGKHGINLPNDTAILYGHTHPQSLNGKGNGPSVPDREVLELIKDGSDKGQSKQFIFHDGQRTTIFRGKGAEGDLNNGTYGNLGEDN